VSVKHVRIETFDEGVTLGFRNIRSLDIYDGGRLFGDLEHLESLEVRSQNNRVECLRDSGELPSLHSLKLTVPAVVWGARMGMVAVEDDFQEDYYIELQDFAFDLPSYTGLRSLSLTLEHMSDVLPSMCASILEKFSCLEEFSLAGVALDVGVMPKLPTLKTLRAATRGNMPEGQGDFAVLPPPLAAPAYGIRIPALHLL